MPTYDAVIVGAGPNGLAAAVALTQRGLRTLVLESAGSVGGGLRTSELTLPGYRHDVCSAFHPMAMGSPFLRTLPLEKHGLRWVQPDLPLAHPVTVDQTVLLDRDIDATAAGLGEDGPVYRRILGRMVSDWDRLEEHLLGPLTRLPRHPVTLARFGVESLLPARAAARRFRTAEARALFAGCAAHSFLPLTRPLSASFGWLLLMLAHRHGWPIAAGGSQAIADAVAAHLLDLGGEIETGRHVDDLAQLPSCRVTLLDLSPEQAARLTGASAAGRAARVRRSPAAYKVDFALDGPVPWANPAVARAGTVHLSGTFAEVAGAEAAAWAGRPHPRPFILVGQQSLFDPSRAPEGKHTLWAYAHVPWASRRQHAGEIEERIEEYAPGFRSRILSRSVLDPEGLERHNPNLVGGDITGGAHTLTQMLFRPRWSFRPYATPRDGVFLCSASTPPGAGTHGMCGVQAAQRALEWLGR